jgi:long-chain fatty acid transport protein
MANDKQKALKHGTHEILLGAEWDVTKQLTISGGYQNTDYGLADDFQSDISFSCDSYSLGFGAAIKMTKHLTMNVAYFWTNYKDYNKMTETALGASSTTYSRTNKVFGLGVDYKF